MPNQMVLKTISWKSVAAVLLMSLAVAPEARSEGAALSGLWSGGGIVVYPSGSRERARCRAHYSALSRIPCCCQRSLRDRIGNGIAECTPSKNRREQLCRDLLQQPV